MGPAFPSDQRQVSPQWALGLLLHHGLLSPEDALLADPQAEETSMSHTAFCVRLGGKPRWYVKRADPVRSQGRDLGSEATVYRLAVQHPVLFEIAPRCRLIGEGGNAIVLDAVDGEPLSNLMSPGPDILDAYGSAVASVHSVRCVPFGNRPWLVEALEPQWGDYNWLPKRSSALLIKLAQSPLYRQAFRRAQLDWRPICLVHGDLRLSNVLVDRTGEKAGVKLIDWELACVGDPAWDVGSFLADAVGTVALVRPLQPSIENLLSETNVILRGYHRTAKPPLHQWASLIDRSLRLAGVRMIQTVIEYDYAVAQDFPKTETSLMPWSTWFISADNAVVHQVVRATAGLSA
ncbi:MAG TPA: aminoglycoside phosphotransferase family protein [Bryobacteraceae bacterium]|nr:aminoglycoside phosphotransferase family protein [Bryobacteraceae bacterium]